MSQKNVEIVIGRLATDEEARQRFLDDPVAAIAALREHMELTAIEAEALAATPREPLEALARTLDPRLQKASLHPHPHLRTPRTGRRRS